jgi:hypothetical protein
LERDDDEEAMELRISLRFEDEENVDAMESRDRHDDADEDVVVELAVLVDMNDEAVELRPKLGKHVYTQAGGEEHTRVYGLGKHPLDQMGRVSCQQGLDVLHRLLWYL